MQCDSHIGAYMNYIVTGATSDIGRAILATLTRTPGALVIATGFTAQVGLVPTGWVTLDHIDLCDDACLEHLREEVCRRFDGPFVLIHSVGKFWQHRPIHRCSVSQAAEMMMSHYVSLYGVARHLLPVAARLGGARLIAFSCNSVQYNYPEMAAFTSAKAAVECLVKCIANEWSRYNVIANAIALPTVATGRVTKLIKADEKRGRLEDFLSPEQIAHTIIHAVAALPPEVNGNALRVFRHSDTFYGQSYFDRNPSPVGGDYLTR
jgi:NAD(P)-dependent dehydrogenase (short-subunit alcohol dehydrogenase family)